MIATFWSDLRWAVKSLRRAPMFSLLVIGTLAVGMGFNTASMERGDALVDIYDDGSVIVRHGGAEIGQGLNTQVTQLVAKELGIQMDLVRMGVTSTAVIPNPVSTGASTRMSDNKHRIVLNPSPSDAL